jgi:ferredoxin
MPADRTFEVPDGTTILLAAVRNGIHLRHDCTEAICGTDRVRIVSGNANLSDKTENEELTLTMMNAGSDNRLGCVAKIHGDVVVELPS